MWPYLCKKCQKIVFYPKMSTIFSKIVRKHRLHACDFFHVWSRLILFLLLFMCFLSIGVDFWLRTLTSQPDYHTSDDNNNDNTIKNIFQEGLSMASDKTQYRGEGLSFASKVSTVIFFANILILIVLTDSTIKILCLYEVMWGKF